MVRIFDLLKINSCIFDVIMQDFFLDFPINSRVWVYQANKAFPTNASNELQPIFDAFTKQWTAHQQQMKAEIRLLHNYFIVVMVDEDFQRPGGCSIDSSIHFIKDIGKQYGIDLLDRLRVSYLRDGIIESLAVNEFVNRIHAKEIKEDTMVMNPLVQSKDELFTKFMIPLRESWLNRYL